MTNLTDEQIADGLVEDGIGQKSESYPDSVIEGYYAIDSLDAEYPNHGQNEYDPWMAAKTFINDWRVAGKCLERGSQHEFRIFGFKIAAFGVMVDNPDNPRLLPRAICEAYVRSLSDE